MQFDTKIAIVVREDLAMWQKMNVTAFLSTGIAFETPELAGDIYRDADGQAYGRMSRQPILVYGATAAALARALDRALARQVVPAVYIEEMFATMHDEANRSAVEAVRRGDMKLAGIGFRAARKVADKILDGLKFHP